MVAAPLAVIAGLLWLANRRADQLAAEQHGAGDSEPADSE